MLENGQGKGGLKGLVGGGENEFSEGEEKGSFCVGEGSSG